MTNNSLQNGKADQFYQPKGKPAHNSNDGREIELLHYVYSRPNLDEIRGSPAKVLEAIDQFGKERHFLMNVGTYKGKIVAGLIAEQKPQTMVELGGYCGYSAILFGDALRRAGGKQYLSLELNPEFAAVATMLLDLAGLRDAVKIVVGPCGESLRKLNKNGELSRIDLLFLDHWKPDYVRDLKICEELGLISPGGILAADNVIDPGNPPYLEYVRNSVAEKKNDAKNGSSSDSTGNPNLIYESRLIESMEPTGGRDGIELTKCVGVASTL